MNCPRCGMTYGCSCSDWQIRNWAEETDSWTAIDQPAHTNAERYIREREGESVSDVSRSYDGPVDDADRPPIPDWARGEQ